MRRSRRAFQPPGPICRIATGSRLRHRFPSVTGDRPWHADAAFWTAVEEFVFPPETVADGREQVHALLELVDVPDGPDVLDMPCGVGRHAVPLAERSAAVTAVDVTERFVDRTRERAADAGVELDTTVADMREFREPDAFDLACNLYTSFGYFEDPDDDRTVAANLHASLRQGGQLVMSLTSKELLAADFRERTWEERDGTYFLESHEVTDDWSWMDNTWVLVDDGDVHQFDVSHRLYSATELTDLLESVGFGPVTAYGGLDGRDFDHEAERLVVVAEK